MISDKDKYLLTRPLFSKFNIDNTFPTIRNNYLDIYNKNFVNSISKRTKNPQNILLMFNEDKKLNKYWNDPLKYIETFRRYYAVCTPDFSIINNMNENLIRFNTFRNRWLGCSWQQYGINIIPTISWGNNDTYDICFSGIEPHSIVVVSTIGCLKSKARNIFLNGYKEMMKRLKPKIVIIYGKPIKGIFGNIIFVDYRDTFDSTNKSMQLLNTDKVINIKEGEYYGW